MPNIFCKNTVPSDTAHTDQPLIIKARDHIQSGELSQALDILTPLVLNQSTHSEAYHLLAFLFIKQGDFEPALDLYEKAINLDPKITVYRHNLARTFANLKKYDEALNTLSPLLRNHQAEAEDYKLLREILGTAPELPIISWARLLADLRSLSPEQKAIIDDYPSLKISYERCLEENERLRNSTESWIRANDLLKLASNPNTISTTQYLEAVGYISSHNLNNFKSFSNIDEYLEWDTKIEHAQCVLEKYIAQFGAFPGYCALCSSTTHFKVSSGILLSGNVHLREGMICEHCQIHNRGRLLGQAVQRSATHLKAPNILLLEATTPLFELLSKRFPTLIGSEFVAPDIKSGSAVNIDNKTIRHENILALSFPDRSLDIIAHADLLEHIPDVDRALSELHRVLKPGGELIFSMPFHAAQQASKKCAELRENGTIAHLVTPPEYHGPHLVFYRYGWDILDSIKKAGFSRANLNVHFDSSQGLLSTGRFGGYFMQPIIISCIR